MPKLVKICRNSYTVVNNAVVRDTSLGATERGVLLTMLSLPEDWNFSIKGLAKLFPDGERKIATALKKIEEAGYLKRERIHSKDGKISGWKYSYSDEPIFRNESEENVLTNDSESEQNEVESFDVLSSENAVENYVENLSQEPHSQNSDVANSYQDVSPHCYFADVVNADVENSHDNKINNNKINNNKYLSHQVSSSRDNSTNVENSSDVIDVNDFERTVDEVSEQISTDYLLHSCASDSAIVNEIVHLIANVYTTRCPSVRVGGDNVDIEFVRKRFRQLDCFHIEYVLDCLNNSATVIQNRKNYLLTCLFSAPVTIDGYYANQVKHDMSRGCAY